MNLKYIYNTKEETTKVIGNGLRDFNNSITGEIDRGGENFYLVKDGLLLGSIKAVYSWDTLIINDIYYQNHEILTILVNLIFNEFKDKVGNFIYSTTIKQRVLDFKDLGFNVYGEIPNNPKGQTLYDMVNYKYTPLYIEHNYEVFTKENVEDKYKENSDDKINDQKEILQYIVKNGDFIVGGIYGLLEQDYAEVSMLWVHEDYRNKNIATNLLNKFEEMSLEKGYENFILGTAEFQAKGLYEKCGYKVIGELENCPKGYKNFTMVKFNS